LEFGSVAFTLAVDICVCLHHLSKFIVHKGAAQTLSTASVRLPPPPPRVGARLPAQARGPTWYDSLVVVAGSFSCGVWGRVRMSKRRSGFVTDVRDDAPTPPRRRPPLAGTPETNENTHQTPLQSVSAALRAKRSGSDARSPWREGELDGRGGGARECARRCFPGRHPTPQR
jgi:hypothetical protein